MPTVPFSAVSIITLFALAIVATPHRAAGEDRKQVFLNQDRAMPSDIDPQSGFRLPLPKREELDEAGRAAYDHKDARGRPVTAAASL